ncbi:MAG: putative rRNA maturation factor [Candidatus Latescibacterota bacterium]|jgi:probable rRNA maturation factor
MPALHIGYEDGTTSLSSTLEEQFQRIIDTVAERHGLTEAVMLIFTNDEHMRSLNAHFRDKDRTTDVLSFDLGSPAGAVAESLSKEVYISLEQAFRQADEQGAPHSEELARLLAHGLLHLTGLDHDTPEKLEFMEQETDEILRALGFLPTL